MRSAPPLSLWPSSAMQRGPRRRISLRHGRHAAAFLARCKAHTLTPSLPAGDPTTRPCSQLLVYHNVCRPARPKRRRDYGDTLLDPLSLVGFDPCLRGLGSRPVSAGRRPGNAADRSGHYGITALRDALSNPRTSAQPYETSRLSGQSIGGEYLNSLRVRELSFSSARAMALQPLRQFGLRY